MALKTSCSIRFLLVADVLANLLQFEPDGRNRVSAGPEVLTREVPLPAAQPSHGNRTLPLQEPITEATGYFGGIAMHICTWSGLRCPSRIWHSFCRAKAWKTSPKCWRTLPNNTFRRRLGINTTWYMQSHLEWDSLW